MRLLVVEDEMAMAESLRAGLEAEGFAVDVAGDGEEALWYAAEVDYDAIILDLMLPKVNGFVVCRTLRERENWVPVLMLTAKDGHLDEAEGLDTGADDYLTKPFSFVVLLARLRALLRRRGRERPTVLRAGPLGLDPARREVHHGDEPVALTAKEFAVLEYLMRRAGDVVPKPDILANVWDFNFDGDPNIVEVYIRSLRRKIDERFDRTFIETVRGAGYRLIVATEGDEATTGAGIEPGTGSRS
ncbi:MAG: response regulator transcription factor [Acidimicrobiia bacterium]|nr:response regulator transcription factor [Acidimicrobiia bacterium]MDH5520173.1 response regulator transcription factor [Acidimicrobiia bacterium]